MTANIGREFLFFRALKGDQNNSLLHHKPEDWYAYAEGFKVGSDTLVQRLQTSEGWGEWDLLVYPICFGYRHYLELKLKQIIRRGGAVVNESAELGKPEHRLLLLWARARTILTELWPPEADDKRRLQLIEEVIAEFDRVDHQSYAFRYPLDNQMQQNLHELTAINVRHLAQTMTKVASYLDGAGDGIEEARDAKAEETQYDDHYEDYPDPSDYDYE